MLRTPLCDELGIDYPIFTVGFASEIVRDLVRAAETALADASVSSQPR